MNPKSHSVQLSRFIILIFLISCDVEKEAPLIEPRLIPANQGPVCISESRSFVPAYLVGLASLSAPVAGTNVVFSGDKLFFAGPELRAPDTGMGFALDNGSKRVDIYDLANRSVSVAELSQSRAALAAVGAGNKVFFAGGKYEDLDFGDFYFTYKTVDIFDLASGTWKVDSLSLGRSEISAASAGDKVIFAGGRTNWQSVTDVIDIYHLNSGTWSTARLSEPRSNMSVVTAGDKIYFAGGLNQVTPSKRIDIYDVPSGTWSTSELLEPMGFITGIAVGNRIYWASDCRVEIRDLGTQTSTRATLYAASRWMNTMGQNIGLKDNKLIFFRHFDATNYFDLYDIPTNTWSVGVFPGFMPRGAALVSKDNTVYIAGDYGARESINKIWTLEF